MQTYILTDAQVFAYLRDLWTRLSALGDAFPKTWYSVGISGDRVARDLLALMPAEVRETIDLRRVKFDRASGNISPFDASNPDIPVTDKDFPTRAFLVDGPVHSGSTMRSISKWLTRNGVEEIISYGLVVKRSSTFVPSFFGLMVGEHDRAYFQFTTIPNHRLNRKGPFGVLRALEASDAISAKQKIYSGDNSLSEITLSGLWYARKVKGEHVYLYELAGEVVGFVHFVSDKRKMVIDALAVEVSHQKKDIAGLLLRWVENWARNYQLLEVELWSIKNEIEFYEHMKYKVVSGADSMNLDDEEFVLMTRRLLYNIEPELIRA
jgi:GNAT superfamily N-acetyltransferase